MTTSVCKDHTLLHASFSMANTLQLCTNATTITVAHRSLDHLKKYSGFHLFNPFSTRALATKDLSSGSIVLLFTKCHQARIKWYITFPDNFLSVTNRHLCFLQVVHGLIAYLFLMLSYIILSGHTLYLFLY